MKHERHQADDGDRELRARQRYRPAREEGTADHESRHCGHHGHTDKKAPVDRLIHAVPSRGFGTWPRSWSLTASRRGPSRWTSFETLTASVNSGTVPVDGHGRLEQRSTAWPSEGGDAGCTVITVRMAVIGRPSAECPRGRLGFDRGDLGQDFGASPDMDAGRRSSDPAVHQLLAGERGHGCLRIAPRPRGAVRSQAIWRGAPSSASRRTSPVASGGVATLLSPGRGAGRWPRYFATGLIVVPQPCLEQRPKPVVCGQLGSDPSRRKSGGKAPLSRPAYDLFSGWSG